MNGNIADGIGRRNRLEPATKTFATVLLLILLALAGTFVWQTGRRNVAEAGGGQGGWASATVFAGIFKPSDFAFAADGRVFVATLHGEVRIVENGQLLPNPFYTVFANGAGERGLVGLALDPDFASNGYVYLYYTHETNIFEPNGVKTGRLIRVTANGNVAQAGSEVVLLGSVLGVPATPSCLNYPSGADCLPADGASHVGGTLRFAPDGTLFVATGDASYLAPDPTAMMVRAQDLDWLGGKLLRINPEDGSAPPDNPFYTGDPSANRSKVFAYGFRQPFRFSLRPGTAMPFVGEVGSAYYEEIDAVTPGGNYGWPCFEGYVKHPTQQQFSFCQALYASDPVVQHPAYIYVRPPGFGAAVIGGVFANSGNYPPDMSGAYFYADWIEGGIRALHFDAENAPLGPSEMLLATAGKPVDFEVGPDGDVYYLTWPRDQSDFGDIRHLEFIAGNRPPAAHADADVHGGLAPLTVQFSSSGSSDPDGDTLSYAWDFDDGASSTEPSPTHEYVSNGTYQAELTVDDGFGGIDSAAVTIVVGNRPPTATITTPSNLSAYEAWASIAFLGTGSDPETGPLPPSALNWSIGLRHCEPVIGGGCHTHPYVNKTGASGTTLAPEQGDELLFLVITLTATDNAGLTGTTTVTIGPDSDADGLLDFQEALTTGTDPFDPDTDGGGANDTVDAAVGNPFDPGDDAAVLAGDADGDGCTNPIELGPNEELGGRRDPTNAWDFYDTDGNRQVDLFYDIFGVADAYGTDADDIGMNEPDGYDAALDRSAAPLGMDVWDMGPPNGTIDLFTDIFGVALQYGHHC